MTAVADNDWRLQGKESIARGDVLVVTESCYVGVFDLGSPVSRPRFWKRECRKLSLFRPRYWFSPRRRAFRLFELNESLMERMKSRQLLCWILLFDGVFRARLEVADPVASSTLSLSDTKNLGRDVAGLIDCPTGRVTISCLSRAGEAALAPSIVVPAGRYCVQVARNDSEYDHQFLEDATAYPSGDGPDWCVTLRRVVP